MGSFTLDYVIIFLRLYNLIVFIIFFYIEIVFIINNAIV